MSVEDDRRRVAQLAEAAGIETSYTDVRGELHEASTEALLAVLRALGVEVQDVAGVDEAAARWRHQQAVSITRTVVVWADAPIEAEVRLPPLAESIAVTLRFEEGGERTWELSVDDLTPGTRSTVPDRLEPRRISLEGPFPIGRHRLFVDVRRVRLEADVLVAPTKVARLESWERLWGVFAPVYSLPGGTGIGAHLGELRHLAQAIDTVGGRVVGTLPVLATWLSEPFDPSPYAPVSRRHWNELFVDLVRLPELAHVAGAADNVDGLHMIGHAANVKSRSFDYRHQYGYVRGVLEQVVAARASWPQGLQDAFAAHLAAHPEVERYARFRAHAERTGTGWQGWAEGPRSGVIDHGEVDPESVAVHQFGQYAMARDLDALGDDLRTRGQRLYLDLPVGAHAQGYDTWDERELFAWGVAAGAPPDDFFAAGQNWGFPPLKPGGRGAARHLAAVVRHHMQVAGILRLDHVMGLHRMFWVPEGADATEGVYVRYPRDELLATVAIESARSGCVVVGEDLGTVPPEIRDAMDEHGLLGMSVALFNQPSWAGAEFVMPSREQLASVDTHDTPTFAAWLRGLDVDQRLSAGLIDDEVAGLQHDERAQAVENLIGFLEARGSLDLRAAADPLTVLGALLQELGESDVPVVLVTLDDLAGETNPQNVPGTGLDRPNWVQRLPFTVDELMNDEQAASLLAALQGRRLASYSRARDGEP